ncbi:HPP family protein [Ampullimonas aquatilis]|uniref:HPP family protein n=1 Tax=Ampullimonas aquatilis TaxID=1341549 RepID=UPI003C76890B
MLHRYLITFKRYMGWPASAYQTSEQIVATLGGLLGLLAVLLMTRYLLGPTAAVIIVPSMGASAVLVFAIPHSVFAQPWSVLGGNVLSALAGVTAYRLIADPVLAAALAVSLAIGVMHITRSIHPPGGATALAAVIGGPSIHLLGYQYALMPVGLNCIILLLIAVAFNHFFAWRVYPAARMRYKTLGGLTNAAATRQQVLDVDINSAMAQLNVVIDTSTDELRALFDLANNAAQQRQQAALPLVQLGKFYCNDRPGQQWSVRQIVDERRSDDPELDLVIYKVVDGYGLHNHGNCTRNEFARWVGSELKPRDHQS